MAFENVHSLCVLISICRFFISVSSDFNGTQFVKEEQYKLLGIGKKEQIVLLALHAYIHLKKCLWSLIAVCFILKLPYSIVTF